jgi:2-haloalkanoic acid dehalogenase type II
MRPEARVVAPEVITFDIFGTVVDWRRGLREAVRASGVDLPDEAFDRVIDVQACEESGPFRLYASIVASSLESELGLESKAARAIGAAVGTWPLYPDSAPGIRRLQRRAPCVAMTNSDRAHRGQVEAQLGFPLSDWISAEDARVYKPSPEFWRRAAERCGHRFGLHWWHVSAYADYDLETARSLGLTCVFVSRPHARPGPADFTVSDLAGLAGLVEERAGGTE